MKRIAINNVNNILWITALIGSACIILLLFLVNIRTNKIVDNQTQQITSLQGEVRTLSRQVEDVQVKQDNLISCLITLFADSPTATQTEVEGCIRQSDVTSQIDEGTTPSHQGDTAPNASVSAPQSQTSSPNNNQPIQEQQSDIPQAIQHAAEEPKPLLPFINDCVTTLTIFNQCI